MITDFLVAAEKKKRINKFPNIRDLLRVLLFESIKAVMEKNPAGNFTRDYRYRFFTWPVIVRMHGCVHDGQPTVIL